MLQASLLLILASRPRSRRCSPGPDPLSHGRHGALRRTTRATCTEAMRLHQEAYRAQRGYLAGSQGLTRGLGEDIRNASIMFWDCKESLTLDLDTGQSAGVAGLRCRHA